MGERTAVLGESGDVRESHPQASGLGAKLGQRDDARQPKGGDDSR
jgi:hypothetical protein